MINFPKVFCVTLKETPKRTEYAHNHFKQHGLDVEFFEGIYGPTFGLKTTIPNNFENADGSDYFIKSGRIGCFLTHLMLWKTLLHNNYDEILVVEDDVVLVENFKEKLIDIKNRLPVDWQYVFVGHCCLPKLEFQTKIDKGILSSTQAPMCTHAYLIKKSSIPVLIETNRQVSAAIDIQIQKNSLPNLKYYILNPPLAKQLSYTKESDKSEINESFESLTLDSKYD